MLLRILLLALTLLILGTLASEAEPSLDTLTDEVLTPSVQIGGMDSRRHCSGTLVHSDRHEESGEVITLVLTAKHCAEQVRDRLQVHIPRYDGVEVKGWDSYNATVAVAYAGHDISILRLDDNDRLFTQLATIAPEDVVLREAEAVLVAGYPHALDRTVTDGRLQGLERVQFPTKSWTPYYRSTPAVVGGNSGGGLYRLNAQGHYELIGVVSMGVGGVWHLGYHVPFTEARKALDIAIRLEERRLVVVN